jgi:uncharacterized protein (TIGR02118 family)
MIKVIVLCAKRADISHQQFRQHLEHKHLPQVQAAAGPQRLVINHVLPQPSGPAPAYRAIAEDCSKPRTHASRVRHPAGQAINADAPNFADPARQILIVDEHETVAVTRAPLREPRSGLSARSARINTPSTERRILGDLVSY